MSRSTVDKLPSGRFRARYQSPNGRWVSKSFDRREGARRWLRDELRKIDQGDWTDPRLRQTPLSEWAEHWQRSLTDLKPKTLVGYESLLRNHVLPHLGDVPINGITPSQVQGWIADLSSAGLSHSRIRQARQVLGAICKSAVLEGLIGRDPTQGTRLPRAKPRTMVIVSPEQLERLVASMNPPNDLITLTLAYTGIRWGELAALRVKNLELDNRTIRISESLAEVSGELIFDTTKTHRARTVALPGFLAEQIRTSVLERAPDSLTFTTKSGRPLRLSNWRSQVWRPALAASETVSTLRPHDLRHFCASVLIRSGASPVAVARQLGHSSPRVTLDVYSHLFPSELEGVSQQLNNVRREAFATHARHAAESDPDPVGQEMPESPAIAGDSEGSGGET